MVSCWFWGADGEGAGSRACALLGRALILLTALLLAVMPWTEYFCDFDKFLRGGQDVELGLLAVATIFCLALVILQHARLGVALLLAYCPWLSFVIRRADPSVPGSITGLIAALHAAPLPSPMLGMLNLPLQV